MRHVRSAYLGRRHRRHAALARLAQLDAAALEACRRCVVCLLLNQDLVLHGERPLGDYCPRCGQSWRSGQAIELLAAAYGVSVPAAA